MTRDFKGDLRWVTHVRVVAHDATLMPSPEVRALARIDLFVDRNLVVKHVPVARRFATATDEHQQGLITCTPATLAATVWVPRPPAVLVGYGSAVWDFLTPALTRGVARVDLSKIVRLIWPEGPARDPLRMADYVQSGGPARVTMGNAADRLAGEVQAMADILSTTLLVASKRLIELAAGRTTTDTPGLGDTFGSMAGDPRLQAMVLLSAAPMPSLAPVPAPWDDAEDWFALGGEELA